MRQCFTLAAWLSISVLNFGMAYLVFGPSAEPGETGFRAEERPLS